MRAYYRKDCESLLAFASPRQHATRYRERRYLERDCRGQGQELQIGGARNRV